MSLQQQALLGNCDSLFMTLSHEQIREFHKQWYLLTDCALEIFLNTGKTCLLAFNSAKVSAAAAHLHCLQLLYYAPSTCVSFVCV